MVARIREFQGAPRSWRAVWAAGVPVIARGAARARLTLADVEALGADTEVYVTNQATGEKGHAPLAELVRCLGEEGATWYLAQQPVPPCLTPRLPKTPVDRAPGLLKPNVWLGSAGAHTPLHQDHMHNLVIQLDGVKRFTLFAPSDAPYLSRETSGQRGRNYSQIRKTGEVDRRAFPLYRRATPHVIELGPQDVFFMPAYWWHEVLTVKATLMLNYWWPARLDELRRVDLQELVVSPDAARRLLMKYVNLSALGSDHDVVAQLLRRRSRLLALLVLGEMADEFVGALAAKHRLGTGLYPETCEGLLLNRGLLTRAAPVLTPIRAARDQAVRQFSVSTQPPSGLDLASLNRALRSLFVAAGFGPCRRLKRNNERWLNDIEPNAYVT